MPMSCGPTRLLGTCHISLHKVCHGGGPGDRGRASIPDMTGRFRIKINFFCSDVAGDPDWHVTGIDGNNGEAIRGILYRTFGEQYERDEPK